MKTADTHVYRINTGRLLVIPVLWLVFVTLLVATDALAIAALLTLILGPMFYFMVWRSRLELNEQGITHFQFGYAVTSTWQNLEQLSMQRGAEGLYLTVPGTRSAVLRGSTHVLQHFSRAIGLGSAVGDFEALKGGRYIALMPFTNLLGDGPLGRDLARLAPHLFMKVQPADMPET